MSDRIGSNHETPAPLPSLHPGDRIGPAAFSLCKKGATVLGSVTTLGGEVRYVVECDDWSLHIYSPEQIAAGQ